MLHLKRKEEVQIILIINIYGWSGFWKACRVKASYSVPTSSLSSRLVWFRLASLSCNSSFFDRWDCFLGSFFYFLKAKKQQIISRYSAEAEYRSMDVITRELNWLMGLFLSLGFHNGMVFHERTKHIIVDCHFICDAIIDGLIEPSYVSMKAQLANIFAKALGKTQFDFLWSKLAFFLSYTCSNLREGVEMCIIRSCLKIELYLC